MCCDCLLRGSPPRSRTAERKTAGEIEPSAKAIRETSTPLGTRQIQQDKYGAPTVLGLDYAKQLPARENLAFTGTDCRESWGMKSNATVRKLRLLKKGQCESIGLLIRSCITRSFNKESFWIPTRRFRLPSSQSLPSRFCRSLEPLPPGVR